MKEKLTDKEKKTIIDCLQISFGYPIGELMDRSSIIKSICDKCGIGENGK